MYLKIKVTAKAKKVLVEKVDDTTYLVSVKEPAKQNLANKAVLKELALHLKVPEKSIRLVSGHHNPSKIVWID